MMSANQSMSSLASITFPMAITFLLAEYGFRGTLALVMAIDLHLIIAMLVMQPVEWHLKKKSEIGIIIFISSNILCYIFIDFLLCYRKYRLQ